MKDYYKILRISRLANATEIKRAYRRLAVVFHPDKNQSPESSSLFQEINEAHEVLSDPVKRALYDQLLIVGTAPIDMPPPQSGHRDPAYRRKQAAGYRPRPPQPSERLLMMAHLLRYYRMVCLVGLGWCAFLMFDYCLPFRVSVEKVVSEMETIKMRASHTGYVVGTVKGHQFPVSGEGIPHFRPGSEASVFTSRLLNVIVKVTSQDKNYTITSLVSVYQNFMFMPAALFVMSIIALGLKEGIEFRFSFMVAICVFLFFNLIFLVTSIL